MISVVIPSYNHADFINEALDSALSTQDAELEVVVVDDGSTDRTRDLLTAYDDDRRVRVHLQENKGTHSALNRGLGLARGEMIFILDSDDVFDPQRVPHLAKVLEGNPDAALAASWIEIIDADGAPLGLKEAWRNLPPWPAPAAGPNLSSLGDPRLALLETNWISTTSNLAFSASLVREHGLRFAPLRYAHDWDFILTACRHGSVELIERPMVKYRVHSTNTIGEGAGEGQGTMRFEILWVVARHAMRLIRNTTESDAERAHLRDLLSNSAPVFGCDSIFDQMLLIRGADDDPPAAYDALLDPDHPFRCSAIEVLEQS